MLYDMTNKLHIARSLIVFSFLFISKISFPQNEVIRFEHLTVKDGLSQNHVTRILKDSKGFMWFCTVNGLNRYDGKNLCGRTSTALLIAREAGAL